jgi:hypothetical protein
VSRLLVKFFFPSQYTKTPFRGKRNGVLIDKDRKEKIYLFVLKFLIIIGLVDNKIPI